MVVVFVAATSDGNPKWVANNGTRSYDSGPSAEPINAPRGQS